MIYSYFKTAIRHIFRNQWFSLINIIGLAGGMAICMVIISMLREQHQIDRFHTNGSKIYRVITTSTESNTPFATCPLPMYDEIKGNFSGIDALCRLRRSFHHDIRIEQSAILANGFFAENTFFDLFDFELKYGNIKEALSDPFSIILSEKTAAKLGGNEASIIGTTLKVKDLGDFKITGIAKEQDRPSHLYFDVLASYNTLNSLQNRAVSEGRITPLSWDNFDNGYLYLLLNKTANQDRLQEAFVAISDLQYKNKDFRFDFSLQHLYAIAGSAYNNNLSISPPNTLLLSLSFLGLLILATRMFQLYQFERCKIHHEGKRSGHPENNWREEAIHILSIPA